MLLNNHKSNYFFVTFFVVWRPIAHLMRLNILCGKTSKGYQTFNQTNCGCLNANVMNIKQILAIVYAITCICSIGVWRVIYLVRKGIEYKAIWRNVCHIVDCSPNQVKIPINIYSGPFVVSRPNAEIKRIHTPWCTEKKAFFNSIFSWARCLIPSLFCFFSWIFKLCVNSLLYCSIQWCLVCCLNLRGNVKKSTTLL